MLKSGDKPYWDHDYFETLVNNLWDIVIIMLGTNDAKERPTNWCILYFKLHIFWVF